MKRQKKHQQIDKQRELSLAVVDQAIAAAWDGWERSQHAEGTTTKVAVGSTTTIKYRLDDESKRLPGDPRYIKEICALIERRAKLLGLDAPTRTESVDVTEDMLAKLTRDELRQVQAGKLTAAHIVSIAASRADTVH